MDAREFDALMSSINSLPADASGTASFTDYLRALASGSANIGTTIGQGLEFLGSDLGRSIRELGQNAEDYWLEGMTPAGRAIASGGRLAENPFATIGMAATQSAPGIAAMALPGGLLAKGLQGAGVAGRVASGIGALAPRFAPSASGVAGALGASLAEGGYSALSNAAGTMQEALDTLAREKPGMSPEDRYALANEAAQQTALTTAPWTAATGLLTGGGALGPLLSRFAKEGAQDVATKGLFKTVGKAIGAEAGQEFIQSGGEQYLQNRAAIDTFAPNRDPWAEVLNAAIIGGGAGGLMGGVMGGIQHLGDRAQVRLDDIKLANANELAGLQADQIQKERDADLLSRSKTGDELFDALGLDPKEAAQKLNEISPDMTNVAPDLAKALEGASPSAQQQAVRNYLGRLAAVVNEPMAPKVERTMEQATVAPEMSLQDSIDLMLGIGRKLHSREDVRSAFNAPVEPTVVVGEDGKPWVTTKAGDVYAAQQAGWQEAAPIVPAKILNVATNRAWAFENSDETPAPAFTSATTKNWVVVEDPKTKQPVLVTKADAAKKYNVGNDQIAAFKAAKAEQMIAKTDVTEITPEQNVPQREEVIPTQAAVQPEKGAKRARQKNLPQVRKADEQVPLRQEGALHAPVTLTEPGATPAPMETQNAIQKQVADEGVLRPQGQELGLQEVGEGDTESEVVTEKDRQEAEAQEVTKPLTIKQARKAAHKKATKKLAATLWAENHPDIPLKDLSEELRGHWEGLVENNLGTIEASDRIAKAHKTADVDEEIGEQKPTKEEPKYSEAVDKNEFLVTEDDSGNPIFTNDQLSLDNPRRQGKGVAKGSDAVQYVIHDPDGGIVGVATLELANGEPQAILDIVIQDALQGQGWGEKVVARLLASNGGKTLYLEGVLRDAEGFWRKIGAFVDDGTRRGEITWGDYQAARAQRDAVPVQAAEQGRTEPAPVEAKEPIGPVAVEIPFETADGKKGKIRIDDAQQAVRNLNRTIDDYKALLKCLT